MYEYGKGYVIDGGLISGFTYLDKEIGIELPMAIEDALKSAKIEFEECKEKYANIYKAIKSHNSEYLKLHVGEPNDWWSWDNEDGGGSDLDKNTDFDKVNEFHHYECFIIFQMIRVDVDKVVFGYEVREW